MGTMFTIVALAYVITIGAPPEEPIAFTSRHTFLGMNKCQEYLQSEAFAADKLALQGLLTKIVTDKATADLAEHVPSIAITASCQEDNRV